MSHNLNTIWANFKPTKLVRKNIKKNLEAFLDRVNSAVP